MIKILVVDDALDSRIITKKLLSIYNLKILEATDGLQGWKLFIKEKPDLVFLDLYMPNKNGFEVLKKIQEDFLDTPVVIISGDTSNKTIHSCLLNGAAAFLPKPLVKEDFNKIIVDLMVSKVTSSI